MKTQDFNTAAASAAPALPTEDEIRLSVAADYASKALEQQDPQKQHPFVSAALGLYQPLAVPEKNMPLAALSIGMLAHALAQQALDSPLLEQEQRLATAGQYFSKAAEYFERAANMTARDAGNSIAVAQNNLATYYERGLIGDGTQNLEKAFSLRLRAAESGFVEAQVNTGAMYLRGEGVEQSPLQALHWFRKAEQTATASPGCLAPDLLEEVRELIAELSPPKANPAPPRPRGP